VRLLAGYKDNEGMQAMVLDSDVIRIQRCVIAMVIRRI